MSVSVVVGFIFFVLGGISIIRPKLAWNIRTFLGRKVFGVTYKATEKTFKWYKVIGVIYILIGLLFMTELFAKTDVEKNRITPPFDGTVTGQNVCLPHKDTRGPQTLECAFGIKLENGDYYALDFGENGDISRFKVGETSSFTGHFTPIEVLSTDYWQKYDVEGIFSVIDK